MGNGHTQWILRDAVTSRYRMRITYGSVSLGWRSRGWDAFLSEPSEHGFRVGWRKSACGSKEEAMREIEHRVRKALARVSAAWWLRRQRIHQNPPSNEEWEAFERACHAAGYDGHHLT